jgi:hypothetical protein
LYTPDNSGKHFVGVDLKEANYQVLRHYGLASENKWEEFFTNFTQDPRVLAYFAKLKFLRLKALSSDTKIDAEKQKIAWQSLTVDIFKKLQEAGIVDSSSLATYNSDELVFYDESHKLRGAIRDFMTAEFAEWNVKVEEFDLMVVQDKEPFYVKKFSDGTIALKCVQFKQMRNAVRAYNKQLEVYSLLLKISKFKLNS